MWGYASYLRNGLAYDHDFWYICVKWWYISPGFFFHFFKILIFSGFQGSKRAVTKWQNILFVTLHISWAIPHIHICECHLWCIHKCKMISPCCIFIFRVVGVRAKNGPKWQKILSIMLHISESILYHSHLWYTFVKLWYLQVFFHFFKNLVFRVVRRIKVQKMVQNDQNSIRHTPYLRNHTSYDCHLWYTSVKW